MIVLASPIELTIGSIEGSDMEPTSNSEGMQCNIRFRVLREVDIYDWAEAAVRNGVSLARIALARADFTTERFYEVQILD